SSSWGARRPPPCGTALQGRRAAMRSRLELGRGGTPATCASLPWCAAHWVYHHQARWKAPPAITILMAWNFQLKDPPVQAKGRAMALDDKTRTELEAAAFRRLVEHLRKRTDVQNLDLMNLAGFCRNCLSNWMKDAADARGVPMSKDESRETIYGMPYEEWKAKHQKEASKDQQAAFEKTGHKH